MTFFARVFLRKKNNFTNTNCMKENVLQMHVEVFRRIFRQVVNQATWQMYNSVYEQVNEQVYVQINSIQSKIEKETHK